MFDAGGNLGEVCSNDEAKQNMKYDNWLGEMNEALRQSRNPAQVRDILERIEDQYDSFDGPGQELVEQLMQAAQRRLATLSAELER